MITAEALKAEFLSNLRTLILDTACEKCAQGAKDPPVVYYDKLGNRIYDDHR